MRRVASNILAAGERQVVGMMGEIIASYRKSLPFCAGPASRPGAIVYCAAGVYRAGCVRRPPAAHAVVVAPRGAVVAPACRIVNGRRICR
jgi:hypothetical protein